MFLRIAPLAVLLVVVSGFSSCGKTIFSGVDFTAEPNLETVKVALNFAPEITSDLGGSFDVKDYGTVEVLPSTSTGPFSVGFRLNTAVLNDNDYVKLDPVVDLPSGQPIPIPGLNRAFAKVALAEGVHPSFDAHLYVDVIGKEWIGVALTVKVLGSKYIPSNLAVTQGFLKGRDDKSYRAYAAIFGPKVDGEGNMIVPGGIAIFANVRSLIRDPRMGSILFEGTLQ